MAALGLACIPGGPAGEEDGGPGEAGADGGGNEGGGGAVADSFDLGACPTDLGFDSTYLYVITGYSSSQPSVSEPGFIKRVPLSGGTVEVLAANQPYASNLGVTADHVWWTAHGDANSSGSVRRIPKSGASEIEMVTSGEDPLESLTVTSDYVWYTGWYLKRIPVAGGAAEQFYSAPGGNLDLFALDDTHAYLGENTFNPAISRVSLADATAQQLSAATITSYVTRAITVDESWVYFVSQVSSLDHQRTLFRLPKDGSAPREKLFFAQEGVPSLHVSGDYLVFSQGADIVKLAKDQPNGTPEVAMAGANAGRLWVHDGRIFWVDCANKSVHSAPMP